MVITELKLWSFWSGVPRTLNTPWPCMTCRYSYMIDNVILLITGTLHQRAISELVPKCHPLGSFEQMEAVNIAQTPAELYNAILVDTPLGGWRPERTSEASYPWRSSRGRQSCSVFFNELLSFPVAAAFFQDCISEQDLDEMNIEIIRNTLYKVKLSLLLLLSLFYHYCNDQSKVLHQAFYVIWYMYIMHVIACNNM